MTHYVVERQEVGKDNWITVQSACTTPSSEIQGLTDGASYHFRVAPVNDVGQGPWLTTTAPIIAKYPFGKCSISLNTESDKYLLKYVEEYVWSRSDWEGCVLLAINFGRLQSCNWRNKPLINSRNFFK